jgi:pyrroloquinoline quinone biosynthesis protein B
MQIKVLGSAAGGGFPQWNCSCRNCTLVRKGIFPGKVRTQAQIAVSADNRSWFLLGACPDLRAQIEVSPELHPRDGLRQSPIAGVVLSSGDLDHVLGLLLLRELQPLRVYATPSIQRLLREDNSMFAMLNRVSAQALWTDIIPAETFALASSAGESCGLKCEPLPLSSRYPAYTRRHRAAEFAPCEALLGLIIEDKSGNRFAYMPAMSQVDDGLLQVLESTDLLFFDGTFWQDDELIKIQGSGQTAGEMGHIPVSSERGSLHRLATLRRPRKIFIHINNTNPMLDESSAEFSEIQKAGWELAEDGWNIQL